MNTIEKQLGDIKGKRMNCDENSSNWILSNYKQEPLKEIPAWVKVGQRIREIDFSGRLGSLAKITEITERGFKYDYDEIKHLIPRWGMSTTGGEVYLDTVIEQGGLLGFVKVEENYQI